MYIYRFNDLFILKMKSSLKAKTSEELKQYWDEFEEIYSNYMGINTFSVYPIMTNLVKIKEQFKSPKNLNILELSIGSGEGLYYLISIAKLYNITNKKITIHATDICLKTLLKN
jgi:hypothetical protein